MTPIALKFQDLLEPSSRTLKSPFLSVYLQSYNHHRFAGPMGRLILFDFDSDRISVKLSVRQLLGGSGAAPVPPLHSSGIWPSLRGSAPGCQSGRGLIDKVEVQTKCNRPPRAGH